MHRTQEKLLVSVAIVAKGADKVQVKLNCYIYIYMYIYIYIYVCINTHTHILNTGEVAGVSVNCCQGRG